MTKPYKPNKQVVATIQQLRNYFDSDPPRFRITAVTPPEIYLDTITDDHYPSHFRNAITNLSRNTRACDWMAKHFNISRVVQGNLAMFQIHDLEREASRQQLSPEERQALDETAAA